MQPSPQHANPLHAAQAAGDASTPPLDIDALRRALQAHTGRVVRCIETHISWVLLDGEQAWKIKKPVKLDFLDFSDRAHRHRACLDELRLNRRLAPDLYLDVVAVRGSAAAPRLHGSGTAIDWAVRMRQFADDALLGRRLAAGRLDGAAIDRLATTLSAFHTDAARAAARSPYGTPRAVVAATTDALERLAARLDDPRVPALARWCEASGRRLLPTFAQRHQQGWVREGHGDLHLDNLVVLGDVVTAFDGVEFDPALRWIDVQADLAFATMDLHAHGRPDLAARLLDRWLEGTDDYAGLAVHRYYAVYRAVVRALVAAIGGAEGLTATGPDYLAAASTLRESPGARLLITHGVSGSGKSHVSAQLLEAAGAVRLRSDVVRKRLFGLHALASSAALGRDLVYSTDATRRTYARLHEAATLALGAGWPVIVDAAFLRAAERDAFHQLARRLGVPFAILDCRADPALLRTRVAARQRRGDDASEADVAVLERQFAWCEPLGSDERAASLVVDAARPLDVDTLAARWLSGR